MAMAAKETMPNKPAYKECDKGSKYNVSPTTWKHEFQNSVNDETELTIIPTIFLLKIKLIKIENIYQLIREWKKLYKFC